MNRTPEQLAFKNAVANETYSILLEAVAGSGKTTSLLDAVSVTGDKTVCICAYNKAIATEIETKLKKAGYDWKKAKASTVHAIGFGAYRKAFPDVIVDNNKLYQMIDVASVDFPNVNDETKTIVKQLVSLAKQSGIGFLHGISSRVQYQDLIEHFDLINSDDIDEETVIDMSIKVLKLNNNTPNVIDFDDMVYMPLVKGCRFFQFDIVMVDEAQDINATRRAIIKAIVKPRGRVIFVGDRNQAIYGFTGADSNSLDIIKKEFNTVPMPLTVCFRCDKNIISFAQKWNPIIQPFEGKEDGIVRKTDFQSFLSETLSPNDAMICRNTKPLVETAFLLLRKGVAVKVEGRDIGEGLKKLAMRFKVVTTEALRNKLDSWKDKEIAKFTAKGKENKAQEIEDKYETLLVIIDRCNAMGKKLVSDVIFEIDNLFEDTEGMAKKVFTLMSGHRSKGREFPKVYVLNMDKTIPSKYARQQWQLQQEYNLAYVIATRAEKELVLIEG